MGNATFAFRVSKTVGSPLCSHIVCRFYKQCLGMSQVIMSGCLVIVLIEPIS